MKEQKFVERMVKSLAWMSIEKGIGLDEFQHYLNRDLPRHLPFKDDDVKYVQELDMV